MIQYNMHKDVPVHIDIYIYTYIQIVWEIFATLDNPNFMYDNYMYECMCVCSHLYHVPLPRNPQKNHTSNDFGAPSRSLSLFQGNLKLTQPLKHWAESVRAPVLQPGTSTPRHGWPPLWLQHLFWGVAQKANPHKLFHAISIQVCHYQSMKSDIKHQHKLKQVGQFVWPCQPTDPALTPCTLRDHHFPPFFFRCHGHQGPWKAFCKRWWSKFNGRCILDIQTMMD